MTQEINRTLCKVFILLGCALILLSCTPSEKRNPTTTEYSFVDGEIRLIMPGPNVPVEYPLELVLVLPDHVVPGLSLVEGESMYMGSIPLQWKENDTGNWQTTLYLGACTEPQMTWRLTVPLEDPLNQLPPQFSLTFTSVAN